MPESQVSSTNVQHAPVTEQKFVAANMNVAMRQLSEALGEEAILVSSRRVAEGVEVVGRLPEVPDAKASPVDSQDRRQGERRSGGRRATDNGDAASLRAAEMKEAERSQRERERFDLAATSVSSSAREALGDVAAMEKSISTTASESSSKQRMVINLQQSAADIAKQIDRLNRRSDTEQPSPVAPTNSESTLMSTDSLRKLLGETLQHKPETPVLSPDEFTVCHRLRARHIDESLVRELLACSYRQLGSELVSVPALWRCIKSEFLALLPSTAAAIDAGGVYAVTGSEGSGKTSVLLKLVAGFALRGQATDVAVISFAGEDKSASGQRLQRLTKVSGIPMLTINNQQSFDDALKRCSSCRTVLVDTSVNRLDSRSTIYADTVEQLADRNPVAELLCLDATSARGYVDRMIDHYRTDLTTGVIATRTELAEDAGLLVSALIASELPLAYLSSGEVHPNNLQKADNEAVWQLLFGDTDGTGEVDNSALIQLSLSVRGEADLVAGVNLTSDRSPSVADHNLQ